MHDIKWIRDNPAAFDRALARRGLPPEAAKLIAIDERRSFFRQNRWGTGTPGQEVRQLWFAVVLPDGTVVEPSAAKYQDAARLALDMGHSTTKTIFTNYREIVTPEEAERYWHIFPPPHAENIVQMAQVW